MNESIASIVRRLASVRTAAISISLLGFAGVGIPAAAAKVIVATSTIQAAVDAAQPGDTVFVRPGTYHESVRVEKDGITIKGSHAAVIDATGFSTGIRVGRPGGFPFPIVNGVPVCPHVADPSRVVNDFTVKGLTIKNARVAGVLLIDVKGYRLTRGRYLDNPVYGPFPICSQDGRIDRNVVRGGNAEGTGPSVDAGIYVGDSDTVTVRKNLVTNYAIGIEVENTTNAIVRDNLLTGNTTGILAVVLPGLPVPLTADVRIVGNRVIHNNLPNPVAADSGDPVGLLPTGTGILNIGGDRVLIRRNRVIGNDSLGVAILQNPFAPLDPRIEPFPDENRVTGNVVLRNGLHPDPVRAVTPGADIVYDGTGVGTCFAGNLFRTEFPEGITDLFPCPGRDGEDDDVGNDDDDDGE